LATLAIGLVGRAVPQLNVMAVGFSLNTVLALGTLALSLAGVVWLLQDSFEPAVEAVLDAIGGAPTVQ
jgi:flagellar biosynthesis protein FliR